MLNEKTKFSDKEIFEMGTKALIKEIGYSGYLRFIQQIEQFGSDYLKIQNDIFNGMSIDELYKNATENWKNRKQ